jgi:amylosucrase
VPLLYMGDELGLRNDHGYLADPDRAGDNRWLHRPAMPWPVADRRHVPGTVEQRIFDGVVALAAARRGTPQLHAATPVEVVDVGNPRLLALVRRHPLGPLLALHNVTEEPQRVDAWALDLVGPNPVDRIAGGPAPDDGAGLLLIPYQAVWLTDLDR